MTRFNSRNKDPLHVLLASAVPPPHGGIATWTRLILNEASRHPHLRLHFIDMAPRWRAAHRISLPIRALGIFQAARDAWRIRNRMKACRMDALHLNTSAGLAVVKDIAVLSLAKRYHVRSIYHLRMGRLPVIIETKGWEWELLRHAFSRADVILVLDRASERALRTTEYARIVRRIPNGIDLMTVDSILAERKTPMDPSEPTVIYVGHLLPAKGIQELVEACVSIDSPSFRLALIGPCSDPFRDRLLMLARTREDGHWLTFHGELPNEEAIRWMAKADILTLPSHTEGFPNVLMEAMAASLPIVATNVGAIPEILEPDPEGRAVGICVPPSDVNALRIALRTLLEQASLRRDLGRRARERVESRYAIARLMKRYLDLWTGDPTDDG